MALDSPAGSRSARRTGPAGGNSAANGGRLKIKRCAAIPVAPPAGEIGGHDSCTSALVYMPPPDRLAPSSFSLRTTLSNAPSRALGRAVVS